MWWRGLRGRDTFAAHLRSQRIASRLWGDWEADGRPEQQAAPPTLLRELLLALSL